MIHPLIFSWNWITMPVGFSLLIYIAWQSRKPKVESISDLDIEFIPSNPKPAKKHPCQIRIRNKNSAKNADDLKVEILFFTDELSAEHAKYYHPEFPYLLKLDSQNNTINPLDAVVVTVFYFESASKIEGREQKFVAGFDLVKSTEKKYASFLEKKNYLIKFAASARGMARVEKEFKMVFSAENGIGRIHLAPITIIETSATETQQDDKIVRKQIKDSLAVFRIWIQALQGKLSEIPYYSYYDEKKQKLEQDYLDMDNQAYRILKDKVGNSEAVSFADEEQIPKVIAPPVANFDMPAFRDRWIDHKFMSNRLEYKKQQLEKIEAKLDSKDFILSLETSPNLFV